MTALRITLKTSSGQDVSLRAGKPAGWPDGARMRWVRVVDGRPEMSTASLTLDWSPGVRTPVCNIDLDACTPWDGYREANDGDRKALSDNQDRLDDWAHTFQARVEELLAGEKALTPFADLHWHETEAARVWAALDSNSRGGRGTILRDGSDHWLTAGEASLAQHVLGVILETAERESLKRAGAGYECLGGVLETEPCAGNEAWRPSVPVEALKQAEAETRVTPNQAEHFGNMLK